MTHRPTTFFFSSCLVLPCASSVLQLQQSSSVLRSQSLDGLSLYPSLSSCCSRIGNSFPPKPVSSCNRTSKVTNPDIVELTYSGRKFSADRTEPWKDELLGSSFSLLMSLAGCLSARVIFFFANSSLCIALFFR